MFANKRILFILLFAMLWGGAWLKGAAVQPERKLDPQATKILKATFEKYHQCKTYQDQATLTIYMMKNDGERKKQILDSKLIFVRPNKMVFVWPSLNLICDGISCQSVYPDFNQYVGQESPSVFTAAFMKAALMEDFLTLALHGLISEKPYEALVDTLQRLEYLGTVEKDGQTFHKISFVQGPDYVEVLIDARTLLLKQVGISPKKGKSRKWELQLVYKKVVLDAPIPDSTFRVSEPKNIQKVDRFSFTRQNEYAKLDQKMPEVSLEVFGTNRKVNVGNILGSKLTFVTFWATWCPPCRAELPELEKLYQEYKSKGFQVIGINTNQDEAGDEIKGIVNDMNLTYPILLDANGVLSKDMLVESIPMLLVLDPAGKIIEAHVGTSPRSPQEFKAIVEQAVGKASSAKPANGKK
jgi:thiol-disulfide isomerase/thioredoxin